MAGVLDSEQVALLTAVSNCLIPARGDFGGCGGFGAVVPIEAALVAESGAAAHLSRWVADDCGDRRPALRGLGHAAGQEAALRAVETTQPRFFAVLVEHAYRHDHTDPRVQRAVGMVDGPPQPNGHQLPAFDEQLLTIQRKRTPFWRRTS